MIDLELDNLRVAEETTLGRASISGQEMSDHSHEHENNLEPKKLIEPEPIKKTNFNDIFAQLEDVSDQDVLFEDIDDSPVSENKEEEKDTHQAQNNGFQQNQQQKDVQDKLEDKFKGGSKSKSLRMINSAKIHDPYLEIQRYILF